MAGSGWMTDALKDARAVYGGAAEACGIAAWAMRKTDVPVLYDVHTPAVGERWMAFRMNRTPRELAIYMEACISELICIRKSDHLLWSSRLQAEYYARRGFPKARMTEVRHGVDLERYDVGPLQPKEKPLVVYAGTMRAYQGAELLIDAYCDMKPPGVKLRMIGFTKADETLRQRAEGVGIETHPMIAHEHLIDFMRDASATVIVAHPDAVTYKNGAAPTKWPESLALGRPVLSVDAYDTRELIAELGVGWVVSNSSAGLARGFEEISATPLEELREMGRRARAEAERHYGWDHVGGEFVKALRTSSKRQRAK
jgi:glycosyltransferase involved in cell wall biosynthesis